VWRRRKHFIADSKSNRISNIDPYTYAGTNNGGVHRDGEYGFRYDDPEAATWTLHFLWLSGQAEDR
jgi:hypothetical protein